MYGVPIPSTQAKSDVVNAAVVRLAALGYDAAAARVASGSASAQARFVSLLEASRLYGGARIQQDIIGALNTTVPDALNAEQYHATAQVPAHTSLSCEHVVQSTRPLSALRKYLAWSALATSDFFNVSHKLEEHVIGWVYTLPDTSCANVATHVLATARTNAVSIHLAQRLLAARNQGHGSMLALAMMLPCVDSSTASDIRQALIGDLHLDAMRMHTSAIHNDAWAGLAQIAPNMPQTDLFATALCLVAITMPQSTAESLLRFALASFRHRKTPLATMTSQSMCQALLRAGPHLAEAVIDIHEYRDSAYLLGPQLPLFHPTWQLHIIARASDVLVSACAPFLAPLALTAALRGRISSTTRARLAQRLASLGDVEGAQAHLQHLESPYEQALVWGSILQHTEHASQYLPQIMATAQAAPDSIPLMLGTQDEDMQTTIMQPLYEQATADTLDTLIRAIPALQYKPLIDALSFTQKQSGRRLP